MSDGTTSNLSGVKSALQVYRAATQQQIAAMESLQRTSDILLQSISHGDMESLGTILDRRTAACVEMSRAFAGPAPELDLAQLARSAEPELRSAAAEVIQTRQRVECLKEQTLTAQQECETALRTALEDVRRQLRETAGHRKVRTAYQSAPAGPPRFLDHRK